MDTDIAIESTILDFLRGSLKDGDTTTRKERVFEFFKSHQDVCKPSPFFKKTFTLQQKSGDGPDEVFATFSPFHLAIVFLADMKDLGEKMKLTEILNQRMIEDKGFAREALFTQVDNENLFNKVEERFPLTHSQDLDVSFKACFSHLLVTICSGAPVPLV